MHTHVDAESNVGNDLPIHLQPFQRRCGLGLNPATTPLRFSGGASRGNSRPTTMHLVGAAVLACLLGLTLQPAPAQGPEPAAWMHRAEKARKAGNYTQAIALYQKALELAPTAKHPAYVPGDLEWQARTFLALSYKLLGNPRKALELHEQNLRFARQHAAQLSSGPMNRELDSMQALAADYSALRDFSKAAALLEQALAIASKADAPGRGSLLQATLTQQLGIAQILAGNATRGEQTLYASLAAFDEALPRRLAAGMPSVAEYEGEVEIIRWLQKSLVAHNRTDAALELAEKGRARAFSALLARRIGTSPRDAAWAATPTLAHVKAIAAAQRSTVVEYAILYDYDPDLPLEFSDYTQIPATDILAWVIKPSGEIAFHRTRLDPPLLLADLVRSARESLGARGRGVGGTHRPTLQQGEQAAVLTSLRRLHQLLIQPIMPFLPADRGALVTFVPQDALFLVPFAALQDDTGTFLVERYALATAPSMQILALTRRQQDALPLDTRGALVVGNPTMPPVEGTLLADLPGAAQEAKAIAAQLKAPVLLGRHATKKAVMAQMPGARVIHLATHGLLDEAGEGFSSLAFAPSDGDRGLLAAREILALKLNAELVVLSACDTAQGKITGDGIQGLSRSLLAAGASSVIVSLWALPDTPTASLMTTFYGRLQRGADKATALRQAMLTTMRQYPQPIDWAAFTLIGDLDVSPTLKKALESGLGGAPADGLNAPVTRYRVFPVPEASTFYKEWPSQVVQGEVDVSFNTTLTIEEVMRFYRSVFLQEGLMEDPVLTQQGKKGFQLVFKGAPNHKALVVQGVDMSDIGTHVQAVSVRFE